MMKVLVGNRLEKLVDSLAEQLNAPLTCPLAPETIVVQSAGMSRWLYLELAARHGIAANYRFPFPNAFAQDIFSAFLPDEVRDGFFDESVMTWLIFELLPDLVNQNEYAPLAIYLGDASDQRKRYQLAKKIAWTFDQYLLFRPEMISKWEKEGTHSPGEIWQAGLWRKIIETQGGTHKASLRRKLLAVIDKKPCRPEKLPERLSVFGISYLPPYHLDILHKLSSHMPVNYYYLNPSREFWSDIKSGQEISRELRKLPESRMATDDDLLHWDVGNSLLASWGTQGRDFFRLMEDMPVEYIDLFEEPDRNHLLQKIQSDIYWLREPNAENGAQEEMLTADQSIQIHACHSELREVETLHDVLLEIMERNNTISPKNILVMTPDIERYAPCIEAVFEARSPRIPYTISDRSQLSTNPIAGGLLALLDMAESRFTTGDVLSLLENPAICEKFAITSADLDLIRHWVSQTQVKWGIDGVHRQSFDLPSFEQNTWREGLQRMLAGFTLDGRRQEMWEGILPYGEIESQQADVLGRFLDFWESIIEIREKLHQPHPLNDWCGIFKDILQDCLPSSDVYQKETAMMQEVISRLQLEQKLAGNFRNVSLNVVRDYLRENAGTTRSGSSFLAGGVSFCAMVPMRNIPFNVIGLMGLNSGDYPRRDGKTGFNLMENSRRAGDRLLRNDDQYVFLEALLSARKYFIVTHMGLSQTDNSVILPSVLACDLLDYLDRNYKAAGELVLRRHRLHAFSPAYFGKEKNLFSYSRPNYLAARAILGEKEEEKRSQHAPAEHKGRTENIIALSDLLLFYRDPTRYYLENCLSMKLPDSLWPADEESEPFVIDSLNDYLIKQELVEDHLLSGNGQSVHARKRAQGVLPVGSAGDHLFDALRLQAQKFASEVAPYLQSPRLAHLRVNLSIGDNQVTGTLDHLHAAYSISYRMTELKMKDYLDAWINHVVLNVAATGGYPQTSLLLGEDGFWCFEALPDARETLSNLIACYRKGKEAPLKLFARSSWKYASALWQKNRSREEAIRAAIQAWLGDEGGWMRAESEEVACKIGFSDVMPIDEEFEETADDILKDLFTYMKKVK